MFLDIPHAGWAPATRYFVLDHRKSEARARLQVGMGRTLFILVIDDINTSDTEMWKYVDDTTVADPVAKNQVSTIQDSVNDLVAKSDENKFQLNERKCEEMRISFVKNEAEEFASIVIDEKAIVVSSVRLLGLNISKDLKWICHLSEISASN